MCTKRFTSSNGGHADTMAWMTIGNSGFQTQTFDVCFDCQAHLLIEIKQHVESRTGTKKK